MGTCCWFHLLSKVLDYTSKAEGERVTVERFHGTAKCDYCNAPADFSVMYTPK